MHQNKNRSFLGIFSSILLLGVLFSVINIPELLAQTAAPKSQAVLEREAQLKAQLAQLEEQIKAQQAILSEKQKESSSIERDIAILDAKIAQAKLIIKEKTINIEQLGADINVKSKKINTLTGKLDDNQQSLSQLIKKTNEIDTTSLAEIMLGNQGISDFFNDADAFDVIKSSLFDVYQETKSNRELTQSEKTALDKRKNAEEDARQAIVVQRKNIEADEAKKQKLLALNKTEQQQYQSTIASQEKVAASIRSALFALRDSAAIPFGTALDYANYASKQTGVRPAFILAILTQESNLGENVGACYLRDFTTGAGIGVTTGVAKPRTMSPTRDVPPFLVITKSLGLDPQNQRVSCWMTAYSGGVPIGWGGAMGPSQFIPSTWQIYAPKLAKLLNVSVPNPWDPKHAIMATALYLSELGAGAQTYTAERTAALRYYAGGNWSKPANAFYGDQVMVKAQNIQLNMIDPLEKR